MTERKHADETPQEDRKFAETLIEHSAVATFVLDRNHRVLIWNRACTELTGFPASQMIGTDNQWKSFYDHKRPCLSDIVLDGDFRELPNLYPIYGKSALSPGALYAEDWYQNLNGKDRFLLFDAAPVYDSTGELIAAIETLQDITKHKQAESLRESEDKFRNLAERSLVGIYLIQDGLFRYVNPRLAKIFGYEVEELLHKKGPKDLVLEEDWPLVEKNFQKRLSGEVAAIHYGFKGITKKGEIIFVEVYGTRLLYQARPAVIGTLLDITEKKEAEEKLRQSEKAYRRIVETAREGIWSVDGQYRTTFVNATMAQMLGYPPEEMIGAPIEQFLFDEDIEDHRLRMKARNQGFSEQYERRYRRQDNSAFWCLLSATPLQDDEGQFSGSFVMCTDITKRRKAEEELRNVAKFPEENPSPVLRFSLDGTITYANSSSMPLRKYWKSDVGDKIPSDILGRIPYIYGSDSTQEIQVVCDQVTYALNLVYVKDAQYVNVYGRDITEQMSATEEMRKLSLAAEESSDWILITDKNGDITYANKSVEKISGYTKKELVGKNSQIFKSTSHDQELYKELWETIQSGRTFSAMMRNRKKTGEIFEMYHTITPLKNDNGEIAFFVVTSKDLTQLKALEDRLNYLAYFDALTGLPNRSLFLNRLEQSISRLDYSKRHIAVLSIDIDRFKLVNDTLGYEIGDQVLIEIGKTLSASVREGDTVARFGNDEFEIALVDVADADDIIFVADDIMKDISRPMNIMGNEIVTTVTMGIAISPEDGRTANDLLKNATLALGKAREQGRKNYLFYTPAIDNKASEMLMMERRLFNALKHKEFVLYYQPYVDTDTKRMVGMEALIRWRSPDQGLVPPQASLSLSLKIPA